jgi:hypothetical protein
VASADPLARETGVAVDWETLRERINKTMRSAPVKLNGHGVNGHARR